MAWKLSITPKRPFLVRVIFQRNCSFPTRTWCLFFLLKFSFLCLFHVIFYGTDSNSGRKLWRTAALLAGIETKKYGVVSVAMFSIMLLFQVSSCFGCEFFFVERLFQDCELTYLFFLFLFIFIMIFFCWCRSVFLCRLNWRQVFTLIVLFFFC